jgi:hypothetical protein
MILRTTKIPPRMIAKIRIKPTIFAALSPTRPLSHSFMRVTLSY